MNEFDAVHHPECNDRCGEDGHYLTGDSSSAKEIYEDLYGKGTYGREEDQRPQRETPGQILADALNGQAPTLSKTLAEILTGEQVVELAQAIKRSQMAAVNRYDRALLERHADVLARFEASELSLRDRKAILAKTEAQFRHEQVEISAQLKASLLGQSFLGISATPPDDHTHVI